jgi:hypothetical protein
MTHYIIFHPEDQRQCVAVTGEAIISGSVIPSPWTGDVWVDQVGNGQGNEDPFVFNHPWMYSYCHATQLRRRPNAYGNYLQPSSYIIFCNGDKANQGWLEIDTVFVVGSVHQWQKKPPYLPNTLLFHKRSNSSLWLRHLQLGLPSRKQHLGKFTYEAEMWSTVRSDFSYLPLDLNKKKVSLQLKQLGVVGSKISGKVKGKYPCPLDTTEMNMLLHQVSMASTTKVVRIIHVVLNPTANGKPCKPQKKC